MKETKSAAKQAEKTVTELSGAARDFARDGADLARHVSAKTKATAEDATNAADESYSTLTRGAFEFQRKWFEIIRQNTDASLDFVHQLLAVKSPSAFVELTAEHGRKQTEAFTEQARHLTGVAQKMTADAVMPWQASWKKALNRVA